MAGSIVDPHIHPKFCWHLDKKVKGGLTCSKSYPCDSSGEDARESGFEPVDCIYLKVCETFPTDCFGISCNHEPTFLWGILLNSSSAGGWCQILQILASHQLIESF